MERRDFLKTTLCATALAGTGMSLSSTQDKNQHKPLFRVSENHRYLIDALGNPFFVMGDTPWFIQKLKIEEVRYILDDRLQKGYNTLLLEILDDSVIPSVDGYGNHAFETDTDITRPAEAYWKYAEEVLEETEKRGFFIVMSPIWYGWGEGLWMHHITPEKVSVYGEFLGRKFARFHNLMWLNAGDRNPDENLDACTRMMVSKIKQFSPHHLHTVHNAHDYSSASFYDKDTWLDVNTGYTYGKSYLHIMPEYYRNNPVRPVILGETGYEGEPNDIHSLQDENSGPLWTPYTIRRNAWWAVLSGACGYIAGSRLWRWESNWKEILQVRSTLEAPNILRLFKSLPWWKLVPDSNHRFVTSGYDHWDGIRYVTAAITPDGNCAVAYLPNITEISVNPETIADNAGVFWYDPTNGNSIPAEPEKKEKLQSVYKSPGKNAAGEPDWVLVFNK